MPARTLHSKVMPPALSPAPFAKPLVLLGLLALFVVILPAAVGATCESAGEGRLAGMLSLATPTPSPTPLPAPIVSLEVPGAVHQGLAARIAGRVAASGAGVVTVRVDFGDGESAEAPVEPGGRFAVEHTYLAAGYARAIVTAAGATGSGNAALAMDVVPRRLVFVQGMNSNSACPAGRHFLDRAPEWVAAATGQAGPLLLAPGSAAFFSYSGGYCGGASAVTGAAPDYGEGDTCGGIAASAAPRLRALIDALAPAKVTVVAHSMGGLVTAYLAASDPSWARDHIVSVVTFDSPLGGIDGGRAELLGLSSIPDGGCGRDTKAMDDLRAGSAVTRAAANAGAVVPFFTLDGDSGEDAVFGWSEAVPGSRTSLVHEAAHLKVREDHSAIWTRAPGNGTSAKGAFVACALMPSVPCAAR